MRVSGTVDVSRPDLLPMDLAFWPREFRIVNRRDMVIAVSGDSITLSESFKLSPDPGRLEVTDGTVFLEEFQRAAETIDFYDPALYSAAIEQIGSGGGQGDEVAARQLNPFLQNLRVLVDLHVGPGNWLRSREMNVETAGDLSVTFDRQGNQADPVWRDRGRPWPLQPGFADAQNDRRVLSVRGHSRIQPRYLGDRGESYAYAGRGTAGDHGRHLGDPAFAPPHAFQRRGARDLGCRPAQLRRLRPTRVGTGRRGRGGVGHRWKGPVSEPGDQPVWPPAPARARRGPPVGVPVGTGSGQRGLRGVVASGGGWAGTSGTMSSSPVSTSEASAPIRLCPWAAAGCGSRWACPET